MLQIEQYVIYEIALQGHIMQVVLRKSGDLEN
jgi:hypothetical protein